MKIIVAFNLIPSNTVTYCLTERNYDIDRAKYHLMQPEHADRFWKCPPAQRQDLIKAERTNNLDLTNIRILTQTLVNYQGTLIVVSYDIQFLQDIGIEKEISL